MFLLVLVLLSLLIAIAAVLWYHFKEERKWMAELLYLNHQSRKYTASGDLNTTPAAHPVRANITPERERRQTQLHHQALHQAASQQLAEQQAQQNKRKTRRKKAEHQAELPIFHEETPAETDTLNPITDNDHNHTVPHSEPSVISLDEVTRLLQASKATRPELETVVLNLPRSSAMPTEPADEITEDDPAVRHVLRRHNRDEAPARRIRTAKTIARPISQQSGNLPTQVERNSVKTNLERSSARSSPNTQSPVAPSNDTAAPQTINSDDIRSHLMRQRFAGRRTQKIVAASTAKPTVLPVIAEEEVLANLAKIDSPASRDQQRFKRTTTRESIIPAAARIGQSHGTTLPAAEPLSTRFTPFERPAASATVPVADEPSPQNENIIQPSDDGDHTLPWEPPAANPAFRADPSLNEQVSTDIPYIELGDDSEWQQTLAENSPPEPQPVRATAVGIPELPPLPTGHLKPQYAAPATAYHLPMSELLLPPQYDNTAIMSEETLVENGITIEEKLAEFRVKVKVVDAIAGPVITRYEIEPDVGVRGSSVINLEKDLARSLGVAAIRVVETIPGKTCMGLELPNPKRQTIRLSEIFQSPEFEQSASKITLALGQDITGRPVVTDLKKAPHLLVAGTTGSGKSVGVNAMILSMLFKASPEDVRLIMIDPKMLELSIYEGIPHLLAPVVTDMKLAANALTWCVNEMEKRYRLMSHVGVRNLESYNQKIQEAAAQGRKIANPFSYTPDDAEPLEKLPFIIVVVDEFADLMMVAGKQIEQLIARLAQKARAAGIHLILATQRPSVDVITGLIKANIPTRIAFQVSSKIDSRTILDQMGAENLLGQGDMLFLPPGTAYPQRIHGAFVADEEVHHIVQYLKRFGEPDYIDDILTAGVGSDDLFSNANSGYGGSGERDPQFDEAVAFVLRSQKATISSIQRHLRIGYNKAATLVDQMEAEGIVSAPDTNGKRTILARSSGHEDA